jgi:1-acyl-sn-glycerol-3-phosphate acyltransferase
MRFAIVLIRSTLFFAWFAALSVVMNLAALPTLLMPPAAIRWTARQWCVATLWGLKIFAGLDYEIRGEIPRSAVLVAAKHMSMWDTLALYLLLDRPLVVLKRELLRIPFYGWYARKAQMIAIDRKGGAGALRSMAAKGRAAIANGHSVLIFPEGTRRKPADPPAYKPGVAGLYSQLGRPCVPVALNSGLFWTGPGGFLKKPGRIAIVFLPAIPAGLKRAAFMPALEGRIEAACAGLVAEGQAQLAARGLAD